MRWRFVGGVDPLLQAGGHADDQRRIFGNDWGDGTHGITGGDGAGFGSTGSHCGAGDSPPISNGSEDYGVDAVILEVSK